MRLESEKLRRKFGSNLKYKVKPCICRANKTSRCASLGKAMETAAPVEKWKNELHVFPLSHRRLENSSQTTLRVSHSSHSFYYYFYL